MTKRRVIRCDGLLVLFDDIVASSTTTMASTQVRSLFSTVWCGTRYQLRHVWRIHRRSQGCSRCTCSPAGRRKFLGVIYRENL